MGSIIGKEECAEGVKLTIVLDADEANALKGNYKDVHAFCSDVCLAKTGILETGLNKSIKYFQVPKELRMSRPGRQPCCDAKIITASCQKIESSKRICFVYIIPKPQCNDDPYC